MTRVVLIGLGQTATGQICRSLDMDSHRIEYRQHNAVVRDLMDADVVFAGGEPSCYMPLLRRIREARPTLPFIVVTRIPETGAWLDALEAGATDYCSMPIEMRQLRWLMEYVSPRPRSAAA